ncbi:MAG: phosphonate C-P lyase system protein PhnH [Cellvibrionaceae bacterium]
MQCSSAILNKLMPIFENDVDESQLLFRKILKSMSEPGKIFPIENDGDKYSSIWAVAQVLLDSDCSVALYPSITQSSFSRSVSFYTSASIIEDKKKADFVFMSLNELSNISHFKLGTLESPHTSTTVVVLVDELAINEQIKLSGPGIKDERDLFISNISVQQIKLLKDNNRFYPCGVDFIFCSKDKLTAIPRSTKIKSALLNEKKECV